MCLIIIVAVLLPGLQIEEAQGDSCDGQRGSFGGAVTACLAGDSVRVAVREVDQGVLKDGYVGSQKAAPQGIIGPASGGYTDLSSAAYEGGGTAPETNLDVSPSTQFTDGSNGLPFYRVDATGASERNRTPQTFTVPPLAVTPLVGAQPAAVSSQELASRVEAATRQVIATLTLPTSELGIDPSPDANEWGAAAVGEQLWFWTPDMSVESSNVSAEGIDISISAVPRGLNIDTGDGTKLTCARTDRLTEPFRNQKSPSCGHVYASKGMYTIRASRTWQVSWSALGQSGAETIARPAGQTTVNVIELHSLLVSGD